MEGEWTEIPLGEVITLQRGFDLPSQRRKPGKVPIVSSSGISDYHSEVGVKGPGVVTGRYGTIGHVFLIKEDYWPLNTTLWVKDFHGNDPHFTSYLLRSVDFQSCSDKSSVPGVNRNDLHRIPVLLPPLAQQKAIAAVLGALDDKIELNRRMNATLEAMARVLFQSWFVDFDPVRARLDGRQPGGLDPATAALFPDSFQDSEVGNIPKEWEVAKLKDLTSKIGSGATPRGGSEVYVEEGPALIRSQNVYDYEFRWAGLARLTDKSAEELKNVEVMMNDVLLNITGDSILRTCVVDPKALPARVNQHVAIIRAINGIPANYLHFYLVQESMKTLLIGMSAGATRHAITKGHLESIDVLKPSALVLNAFEQRTTPWFAKIDENRSQSRTLATLRDMLLPKLLSGELKAEGFTV
jgi:type I restriction enzyme S subunit